MNYRILQPEDAEQWIAIRTKALDAVPFAFGRTNQDENPERKQFLLEQTNGKDNFIFGAFDDEKLVGVAGFFQYDTVKNNHKGMIWSVYVSPNWQGKGIGKKLMELLLHHAWKLDGLDHILLSVSANMSGAIHLYKSLGFQQYGLEPNCLKINGEYQDAILMALKRD